MKHAVEQEAPVPPVATDRDTFLRKCLARVRVKLDGVYCDTEQVPSMGEGEGKLRWPFACPPSSSLFFPRALPRSSGFGSAPVPSQGRQQIDVDGPKRGDQPPAPALDRGAPPSDPVLHAHQSVAF